VTLVSHNSLTYVATTVAFCIWHGLSTFAPCSKDATALLASACFGTMARSGWPVVLGSIATSQQILQKSQRKRSGMSIQGQYANSKVQGRFTSAEMMPPQDTMTRVLCLSFFL
jgi:hypothetical protein